MSTLDGGVLRPTWKTNGLDGRGAVLYSAVLIDTDLNAVWVCNHRHHSRIEATGCALYQHSLVTFYDGEPD